MNKNNAVSRDIMGWLFLTPAIVVFLLLRWFPMIGTVGLSFVNWDILTPPRLAGFSNYARLLFRDPLFYNYTSNTLRLTFIYLIPTICLSPILAWALTKIRKGQAVFESCYLIPIVAGGVASAMIWRWIYNPDFGLANCLLATIHLNGPSWLVDKRIALKAIGLFRIWLTLGVATLFFYFVFRDSSEKRKVIKWSILIVCLLGTANILTGGFGSAYMMTGGGPAGGTTTIYHYIYNNAYQWFKIGYACSISTIMMGILLILGIIVVKVIEKNQLIIGYADGERCKISEAGKSKGLLKLICYTVLIIFGLYQVMPLVWALLTALKEPAQVFTFPLKFVSLRFHWQNFSKAWTTVPFGRFYIVSILRTVFIVISQVTIAFFAAYSLSILKPRGSRFIFWGIFCTIFVAPAIGIPIFIQTRMLHWLDTWKALIIPCLAWSGGIFIFKMYLDGLFDSIVLKLREEGKQEVHVLRRIISHSKRMIVLVSFISFLASWHAFRWPVIVINSMKMKTLPAGLASFQGLYTTDWTLMMAGVCIYALPVIALFLLLRKYLLKGIYITSLSEIGK